MLLFGRERDPPIELLKLAYSYREELTMREAGNFYHSFKYLQKNRDLHVQSTLSADVQTT